MLVEGEEDRFGLHSVDSEAYEVGQAIRWVSVEREPGDGLGQAGADAVGVYIGAISFVRLGLGQLRCGRAESDDGRNVLDPGAPGPFLRATHHERRDAQPATDHERADPQRSAPGVGGEAHEVGLEPGKVDGLVADRGTSVHVDEHAALARPGADVGDRLERPDFVVRELDRHKCGGIGDRIQHGLRVDLAVLVHAKGRRLDRLARACIQHAGMFDRGGHDPGAGQVASHRSVDRRVDRLGAARGEDHLTRPRADQERDLFAGGLDRDSGDPPIGMHSAGIAEVVAKERHHGVERDRPEW